MFANINFSKISPFSFVEYGFQAFYAYIFLMVWKYPEQHPVSLINDLAILMAFEFVMVHSGVFMAVMPKKISLFVFFPFYGIFAFCFNESVIDSNILYIYLLTVLNRMRFAFSNVSPEIRSLQMGKSAVKAMFYFFLIFAVSFGNALIPQFGLTEDFLQKSHYFDQIKTGGLFTEKPYVPICMGFIYYSLPVIFFIFRTFTTLFYAIFPKDKLAQTIK